MVKLTFSLLSILFVTGLSAQITPEKYYPKQTLIRLGVDSCAIFKESKEGKLKPDLTVQYNKDHSVMTFLDYVSGMRIVFNYGKDSLLHSQKLYMIEKGVKTLMSTDSFIYNSKRLKTKYQSINHSSTKIKNFSIDYTYRNDSLIREVYQYGNEVFRTVIHYFDYKTNTLNKTSISPQAKIENLYYKYDNNGLLSSYFSIGDMKDTVFVQRYKNDSKGRRTETLIYNGLGELENMYRTHYNPEGLIDYEEEFLSIKENKPSNSVYVKKVYRYSYRKP